MQVTRYTLDNKDTRRHTHTHKPVDTYAYIVMHGK